ncbi:hypothetical protein Tco_0672166 [Tanacetum coccineum]
MTASASFGDSAVIADCFMCGLSGHVLTMLKYELLAEALCKVHREIKAELRDEANVDDPYGVAVLVDSVMFEKRGGGCDKLKGSANRSIVSGHIQVSIPEIPKQVDCHGGFNLKIDKTLTVYREFKIGRTS